MGLCNYGTCGVVALFFGAGALIVAVLLPSIVNDKLLAQLKLRNGTGLYKQYTKSSTRNYSVYMFNVTNHEDFLKGGKPKLQEVGPYVYDEIKTKSNVSFGESPSEMSFVAHTEYVYNASKTAAMNEGKNLDPDMDVFILPNMVFFALLARCPKGYHSPDQACTFVPGVLEDLHSKPFHRLTVTDFLFGYVDDVTSFLSRFGKGIPKKFGVLHANNTDPEPSIVRTGVDDISKVGQYVEWIGMRNLSTWGSKYANMINGTDGSFFHHDLHNTPSIVLFVDVLRRSARLTYSRSSSVHGIDTRRYKLSKSELQNATEDPSKAAWYAFGPSGLLNLSLVQGAPVFVSKPHFLDGEPSLAHNVDFDRKTDPSLHDTFLDVEPITGNTLRASKGLQTNLLIRPYTYESTLPVKHITKTYFPIFWVHETAMMSPSQAKKFKSSVLKLLTTAKTVDYVLYAIGGALVLSAFSLIFVFARQRHTPKEESEPLLGKP